MARKYPQELLSWIPGPGDLSSFRVSQTASRKFEAVITGEVNLEVEGSSVSAAFNNLIKQIKNQVGEERYIEIFKQRFELYQEALVEIGRWTLGRRKRKASIEILNLPN